MFPTHEHRKETGVKGDVRRDHYRQITKQPLTLASVFKFSKLLSILSPTPSVPCQMFPFPLSLSLSIYVTGEGSVELERKLNMSLSVVENWMNKLKMT